MAIASGVPAATTVECDAIPTPASPTATDNCDPDPVITYSDDTLSTTCPLSIKREWVATDACGNADTCYQNIIVQDTTKPVLVCPSDRTFECDNVGDFGIATATDNCDNDPVVTLAARDSIPERDRRAPAPGTPGRRGYCAADR